jgi:hypothetical protein
VTFNDRDRRTIHSVQSTTITPFEGKVNKVIVSPLKADDILFTVEFTGSFDAMYDKSRPEINKMLQDTICILNGLKKLHET